MRRSPDAHDYRGAVRVGGQHEARCSCAWRASANLEADAKKLWQKHALKERRASYPGRT